MQKYTKYVKICKNHPRHLYKFLLQAKAALFFTWAFGGQTTSLATSSFSDYGCGRGRGSRYYQWRGGELQKNIDNIVGHEDEVG